MDKATELINGLSEEEIAAYAASSSDEPHITIGKDRVITVPIEIKNIGVQFDSMVERRVFDCPRYWNGLDFADTGRFTLYINYVLPGNVSGRYAVTDVSIDADDANTIHFSCPIGYEVTQNAGDITFSICCEENSDEEFVTKWNSEPCANGVNVSKGLECMDTMFESYPSVMERVERTSTRLDESDEELVTKRLNDIADEQSELETSISEFRPKLVEESKARSAEDTTLDGKEIYGYLFKDEIFEKGKFRKDLPIPPYDEPVGVYVNGTRVSFWENGVRKTNVTFKNNTRLWFGETSDADDGWIRYSETSGYSASFGAQESLRVSIRFDNKVGYWSDNLNQEIAQRKEADAAISDRIAELKIELRSDAEETACAELRASVDPFLVKSTMQGYLYRPYHYAYLYKTSSSSLEGDIYTCKLHDADLTGKCFNGVATVYNNNRFHASFAVTIEGTNKSLYVRGEGTQDIITREDLSRFIFGHNRARFGTVQGFWFPIDVGDGQYNKVYTPFTFGDIALYEPSSNRIPVIGSTKYSPSTFTRADGYSFVPYRSTMKSISPTAGFYNTFLCLRGADKQPVALSDFDGKKLHLRFELTGTIDNETYFDPYCEYTPTMVQQMENGDLKCMLTLNGVGNSVTLTNVYNESYYVPSHSASNECHSHSSGGSVLGKFGEYCTHYLAYKYQGSGNISRGDRAFLFENDTLVATATIQGAIGEPSLHFEWGDGKTLDVAYVYKWGNTTYYDYWRYTNSDTSEQTSQPLTILFDI